MDTRPDMAPPAGGDPAALTAAIDEGSAIDAVRLLIGEAKAAAAGEVELAKACGAIVGSSVKAISLWGIIALIALSVAVMTLAIGLMIALATITGAWLAAFIVPAVLLLIVGFAVLRIRTAANRAKAAVARLSA